MTLIVARNIGGLIYFVSDTQLTPPDGGRVSVLDGMVKIKVLTDHLAIAFAGNPELAETAIEKLDGHSNINHLKNELLAVHLSLAAENTADFIVATLGSNPSLAQVKNGEIDDVASAWIGSADAFHLFRAFETGAQTGPSIPPFSETMAAEMDSGRKEGGNDAQTIYSRMLNCMNAVVGDASSESVGGFTIPVMTANGAFEYGFYTHIISKAKVKPIPGWQTLSFGTAEDGSFAFDVCPTKPNVGVTSYFLQGRFGVVYSPEGQGFPKPKIIRNVSPMEFVEAAEAHAGAKAFSAFFGPGAVCSRSMMRLAEGDVRGAINDADMAIGRFDGSPDGWRCKAEILLKTGRLKDALGCIEVAFGISPGNVHVLNAKGRIKYALGEYVEAIDAYSSAIEKDPSLWIVLSNRATAHQAIDQLPQAHRDLSMALKICPNDVGLWEHQANILERLGSLVGAIQCLENAQRIDPSRIDLAQTIRAIQEHLDSATE